MKESKQHIFCLFYNDTVDDDTCFDISMVEEGLAPMWSMPKEIRGIENFRQKCLECPNHRYD